MNSLGRTLTAILAAILLFLLPLQYMSESYEYVSNSHITQQTTEFTNTIRQRGYMTMGMYNNFVNSIDDTGNLYNIEIEVAHPVIGTDISKNTNDRGTVFLLGNMVDELDTNITEKTDTYSKNINVSSKKTYYGKLLGGRSINKTYDSLEYVNTPNIINNSFTQLATTHAHTAACYDGDLHNHSAYGGSCYTYYDNRYWVSHTHTSSCYHSHSSSCYSNQSCGGTVSYSSSGSLGKYYCGTCEANVTVYRYTASCGKCGSSYGSVTQRACGHSSSSTSSFSCSKSSSVLTCSTSTSSPICGQSGYWAGSSGYNLTCGKTSGQYYNGNTLVSPICNQVVVSITASQPNQTVLQGGSIVVTATATYLDGHTGTVTCTSNYNSGYFGPYIFTLTYSGRVTNAKTIGTKTCSINVTTLPNIVSCTAGKGHPDYSGIYPKCPICNAIDGITISNINLPYTGSQQGVTVTSSTGASTVVYYTGSTTKPSGVGNYNVSVYVVIDGVEWIAKTSVLSIYKVINKITANLSKNIIYKGDSLPITSLKLDYNDGSSATVTSGWSISGFNTNVVGNQTVTISFGGVNTTVSITVKPNTSSLSVNPSKTIMYKGETNPTFTCTVTYEDNTTSNVTGTVETPFDHNKFGTQTVQYSYTENGKTLYASCNVTVKPNVSKITVIPSSYTVFNGTEPTYTVTLTYENNSTVTIFTGYEKTGFTRGAGIKTVTFTYIENGITVSTSVEITVKRNTKTCPYGHTYELDDFDVDQGCSICANTAVSIRVSPTSVSINKGELLESHITVYATYLDGHTAVINDWTSNFDMNKLGSQYVEIKYQSCSVFVSVEVIDLLTCSICGNIYSALADGSDPGCPVCKELVVSITANPSNVSVDYGMDFTTVVTATYKDGHTTEVYGWTSNYDPYVSGNQTVTIFYGNCTTLITVNVIPARQVTCPICLTSYDPQSNPLGCPVCSTTVDSISASLKNGSTTIAYGSNLNLYVVLNYRNGRKEIASSGWTVEGFNATQLGEQVLTIRYGLLFTNLTITVVNNLAKNICPNGHVYYLNDDGSDSGCPFCTATVTEQGKEYMVMLFTNDIIQELELNEIIYFDSGDYITVKVYPKETVSTNKMKFMSYVFDLETKFYGAVEGGRIE